MNTQEHPIHGKIVQISTVKGLIDWLSGQTLPLIEGDENPFDWCFYSDYERFIRNKHILD